ncbi:hypothetical protein [Rossellomorea marisflavi]|uniref:hypothetical protein n=1 Tax=Rossellomorea marisflavi TaxID=189381 RepID=UPI003FA04995
MQKFNQLGLELLSTKDELLNDKHSDVVRKALLFQAESMTENKLIDPDTHLALTDKDLSPDDFSLFLAEKKSYMKTIEELRNEYDVIREAIAEKFSTDVVFDSMSKVEEESLVYIQTFELDLEWVKSYFLVKESDIANLIKEKGFVAKFAVLRIPKIIDEFLDTQSLEHEVVSVERAEHVYLNAETSSYCMDLVYSIPIDEVEDDTTHSSIAEYISDSATASQAFFKEKIS